MNISLTKEFESYVSQKVESGLYQSASEVIRDGLRLMKERDDRHQTKLAELREAIAIGLDQAERGQVQPFNEEAATRAKTRGRKRLATPGETEPA
ncbi:MAG: type II toxin-antitoxin system ParD family antitoxin [Isosphaeraceae bacterium]